MEPMTKGAELNKNSEMLLREILANAVEVIPEHGIEQKLAVAEQEGRQLRVKMGFDPTSPDLHLGHAVSMLQLRKFQEMGHLPVIIVGDFTGMIGDPTGRDQSRPVVSTETLKHNAETYIAQLGKVLDISEGMIEVRPNSEWHGKMVLEDAVRLLAKGSLAKTISRKDFQNRLKDGSRIGLHEIIYPLIMGYDSVAVKADIELGGTDQLYGFQAARMLQPDYEQDAQTAVMMPLLTGLDGTKKMSKSLGNHVGLTDVPNDMYGKLMSIPDKLIEEYLRLASTLSVDEVNQLVSSIKEGSNPMEVKKELARNIVATYHDAGAARAAADYFERQFSKRGDAITYEPVAVKPVNNILNLIIAINECSASAARRLIQQGAVQINGKKITDIDYELGSVEGLKVKTGKRKYYKVSMRER